MFKRVTWLGVGFAAGVGATVVTARKAKQQLLAENGCFYMAEFADDAILGTALKYDNMKLSATDMFNALRVAIFRGLTDHEMGHTMGLRHNFSASTDALNYDDRFWQTYTNAAMTDTQKQVADAVLEALNAMDALYRELITARSREAA